MARYLNRFVYLLRYVYGKLLLIPRPSSTWRGDAGNCYLGHLRHEVAFLSPEMHGIPVPREERAIGAP
jgi:hypothetical protein